MFQEYSEEEKMQRIIQVFRKYDLTPDIIRQAADIMEPINEQDELDPVWLKTNKISQLALPEFHYLRRKLNMTNSNYTRLK